MLAVTMGMSMLTGCGASEKQPIGRNCRTQRREQASPLCRLRSTAIRVEWICTAYAVYTQYNHKTLGVIGGLLDREKELMTESTIIFRGLGESMAETM